MTRLSRLAILAGLLSIGLPVSAARAQVRSFDHDPRGGYYPPTTPQRGGLNFTPPRRSSDYSHPHHQHGADLRGREFSPWPPNDPRADRFGPHGGADLRGREFSPWPPNDPRADRFGLRPGLHLPPAGGGIGSGGASIYQRGYAAPPVGPPPRSSAVIGLADTLAAQADEFLQAFQLDARRVPQGGLFLADATTLRNAALRFRDIAADGAPPEILAAEFQGVAASWQQLEGRMAFVSRGRIGPNIATALQMGETVAQIERLLY